MNFKQAAIAVALLGSLALGCGSSPTSSSGFQIMITAGLANSKLAPTILEAQLLVDGATAVDQSPATAAALVSLLTQGSIGSGGHTMQIAILNQTSSPNSYTVTTPSIQVFDINGNFLKTIQLPTQTATLATGGTINYSFSL